MRNLYCTGRGNASILEYVTERVRALNSAPVRPQADYVLYWAQMNRRVQYNQALVYAVEQANLLRLPLLVYEGLACTYRYANDRLHTFVLEGVGDTAEALGQLGAGYCFYLRRRRSDANDVLYRLAAQAALVVTDDYPTFIAAEHNRTVPDRVGVAYVAVDASCVVPMSRFGKREFAAYTIRPKIHRVLAEYMHPLKLPELVERWSGPAPEWHVEATNIPELVAGCEIDHTIAPSTAFRGGYRNARRRLDAFAAGTVKQYASQKNEPSAHATSNLSPYLHFGHISALEVALEVREPAFLEELIVRRELAFNFCRHAAFESMDALPDWARQTLAEHESDGREPAFDVDQLERARTYDELWNATQKELLLRGKIHGYYRMYWGKKILEWSKTPAAALTAMIYLHDKYALDGRDPNTYANVLWCLGLHDRPWFERPVFGKVRYMSFEGMRRKTNVGAYIREIDHLERTGQELIRI